MYRENTFVIISNYAPYGLQVFGIICAKNEKGLVCFACEAAHREKGCVEDAYKEIMGRLEKHLKQD